MAAAEGREIPEVIPVHGGERLAATGLDVLMLLVEAADTANKERLLEEANRKINGIRYLLRTIVG